MEALANLTANIYVKRAWLVFTISLLYVDVGLDGVNAYTLWRKMHYYWSAAMAILMYLPNAITWAFLRANGIATYKDLAILMLQLGPLRELYNSWERGAPSRALIWYTVAEGLGEATMTGVLNGYIVSFGGADWTFYASFFISMVTITKTATTLNFYGQESELSITAKCREFCHRFPRIAFRISSLACFGYLMRNYGSSDDDLNQSAQIALPLVLVLSFGFIMALIFSVEPLVPLPVCMYFAMAMLFTEPMRFLRVFDQMSRPLANLNLLETLVFLALAIHPLHLNPRVFNLFEHAPQLIYTMLASFLWVVLQHFFTYLTPCLRTDGARRTRDFQALPGTLVDRAALLKQRLHAAMENGDLMIISLLVKLEAATLDDPVVIRLAEKWFTDEERNKLVHMGMPRDLTSGEYSLKNLKSSGFRAEELKAGFSVEELRVAEYSPVQLKAAGFSLVELKAAGYSSEALRSGFSNEELKTAVAELKAAGSRLEDLKAAGFSAMEMLTVGYCLVELRAARYSVAELKAAGCSLEKLKAAGFFAAELKAAGYSRNELKAAGCSASEMKAAGFLATNLKAAGYSSAQLKAAGFSLTELKAAGCSALEMKAAGFLAANLKAVGYGPVQVKAAGFSVAELKAAGYSALEMKASGFLAANLKAAGYSLVQLKAVGFSVVELKAVGYSLVQLKAVGFGLVELKAVGYHREALRAAGFTVEELKTVFRAAELNSSS